MPSWDPETLVWPSYLEFVEDLLGDLVAGLLPSEHGALSRVPSGAGFATVEDALRVYGPLVREEALAGHREEARRPKRGLVRDMMASGACTVGKLMVVTVSSVRRSKDEEEEGILSEGSVVRCCSKGGVRFFGVVASARDTTLPSAATWSEKGSWRLLALRDDAAERCVAARLLRVEWLSDAMTGIREFQALKALESCRPALLEALLRPDRSGCRPEHRRPGESRFWTALKARYNESQLAAIAQAASGEGPYALVQGPPGTGKTRTILGMIGALLAGQGDGDKRRGSVRVVAGATGLKQAQRHSASRPLRRVLVTAPSNAAVDELARRLTSEGVVGLDGKTRLPRVCRVGTSGCSTVSYALDALADDASFRTPIVDAVRGSTRVARRVGVILACELVCATLSGAGSSIVVDAAVAAAKRERRPLFDAVVVDEAAQAVEPSSLVPLKLSPSRVVLVGDPKQLSATLLSPASQRAGYGQSLFERLWKGLHPYSLLQTQYRMPKAVANFLSARFYLGRLISAQSIDDSARHAMLPEYITSPSAFPEVAASHLATSPLVFHDLAYTRAAQDDQASWFNDAEADFVVKLLAMLDTSAMEVAIIAPYQAQIAIIARRLARRDVEVATVDAFQGREKDLVVVSCVRAPPSKSIGFLDDPHRLNVALSRCRRAAWLVGSADALNRDDNWRALIDVAKRQHTLKRWSAPPTCVLEGAPSLSSTRAQREIDPAPSKSSRSLRRRQLARPAPAASTLVRHHPLIRRLSERSPKRVRSAKYYTFA